MATSWPWLVAVVLVSVPAAPAHAGEGDLGPARRTLVVRTYNRFGIPAHDLSAAEPLRATCSKTSGSVWCG